MLKLTCMEPGVHVLIYLNIEHAYSQRALSTRSGKNEYGLTDVGFDETGYLDCVKLFNLHS